MTKDKFSQDYNIGPQMSDISRRLHPVAFLDIAQHAAVRAAKALDFGDTVLDRHNCAWILARMHVDFVKPVMFEDDVTLYTWHKGYNGLFFIRDFQLIGADGTPAVNSTSSWIVMNVDSRKTERGEFLKDIVPQEPQSTDIAIEAPAPKLVLPRSIEVELLGTHQVRYSDIDKNGHVNNVRYTMWALDYLPKDLIFNHPVKSLAINFNKESKFGDSIDLWHAERDGAHYVEGRIGDSQIFILKLLF